MSIVCNCTSHQCWLPEVHFSKKHPESPSHRAPPEDSCCGERDFYGVCCRHYAVHLMYVTALTSCHKQLSTDFIVFPRAATTFVTMVNMTYSRRRAWRVRGVPRDFDRKRLVCALRDHPDLRWRDDDTPQNSDHSGNGVNVYTLAPDHLRDYEQVATVRFERLPLRLGSERPLSVDIKATYDDPLSGEPARNARVTIDEQFDGITTLISPSADHHHFDILAISGLGSHPFGSFVN